MEKDDIIYLALLLVSVVSGEFVRRIRRFQLKQILTSAIGLVIVILVSGSHVANTFLGAAINGLIICYASPKYCHALSFVFSFLHLFCYRFSAMLGMPHPSNHTSAVQMLLTLKMVGLALEVQETAKMKREVAKLNAGDILNDNQTKNEETSDVELSLKFQGVAPSFMDVMHYAFCYIGVLTGPYYKYRTYWDMLHSTESYKSSYLEHALQRAKRLPLYSILFLLGSHYFPLSYARSEEIFERSVLYRIWYMIPLFSTFRMRFYGGFILSEISCMMAGLGAYPSDSKPKPGSGPSVLEPLAQVQSADEKVTYNFEAIHNIEEYATEFYDVRGSLKSWNMTVQYWLAMNVYRRFPIKALRVTITMLVSAFWHGVHSGYYLSMLTVPFILVAEDLAKRKFRSLNPSGFDVVSGLAKVFWFSYMGVAFSLLAMNLTLNYWTSIYFIGHVAIVLVYAISWMSPNFKIKSGE